MTTTKKPADKLSDHDLEQHARMVARYIEAQQLANQAQQLQARANQLASAFQVWGEDLHDRYGLDAAKGEGVQEDGTIIRTPQPDSDLAMFAAVPGP